MTTDATGRPTASRTSGLGPPSSTRLVVLIVSLCVLSVLWLSGWVPGGELATAVYVVLRWIAICFVAWQLGVEADRRYIRRRARGG